MVSLNVSVRLCKIELFIAWILASGEEKYIQLIFPFFFMESRKIYYMEFIINSLYYVFCISE